MKKSKVFMAVLAALVLAVVCVSAGCVSEQDPIVGTYVYPISSTCDSVFQFHANGTLDMMQTDTKYMKGMKVTYTWLKSDSGSYTALYESKKGLSQMKGAFKLSEDGSKLYFIDASGDTTTVNRVSEYKIPEGIAIEVLNTSEY